MPSSTATGGGRQARRGRSSTPTSRRDALLRELRKVAAGVDEYSGFWRMGLLLALETGPAVGSAPRMRFLQVRREATERLRDWWRASVLPPDTGAPRPGLRRCLPS